MAVSERHYFRSMVEQKDAEVNNLPPTPIGMDTFIEFIHFKVTRNSYIEAPSRIFNGPQTTVADVGFFVLLSQFERGRYAKLMAKILTHRLHVPEVEQPAIIDKLFRVTEVAVPGINITVRIWDVTHRYLDSATSLGEEYLTRTLWNPHQLLFDLDDQRNNRRDDQLGHHHMVSMQWPESRLTRASNSFIENLKRLRFDSLESSVRQMLCAVCTESLGHFAMDQVTDQQLMVTRLPCTHLYHVDCIVQWLEKNHLCPLCRYPMPTMEMEASKPSEPSSHWNMFMMSAGGLLTAATCLLLQKIEAKSKVKISDHLLYAVPLMAMYCAKLC